MKMRGWRLREGYANSVATWLWLSPADWRDWTEAFCKVPEKIGKSIASCRGRIGTSDGLAAAAEEQVTPADRLPIDFVAANMARPPFAAEYMKTPLLE